MTVAARGGLGGRIGEKCTALHHCATSRRRNRRVAIRLRRFRRKRGVHCSRFASFTAVSSAVRRRSKTSTGDRTTRPNAGREGAARIVLLSSVRTRRVGGACGALVIGRMKRGRRSKSSRVHALVATDGQRNIVLAYGKRVRCEREARRSDAHFTQPPALARWSDRPSGIRKDRRRETVVGRQKTEDLRAKARGSLRTLAIVRGTR